MSVREWNPEEAAYCGPPQVYPIRPEYPETALPASTKTLVRRTNGLDDDLMPFQIPGENDGMTLEEFRAGGPHLSPLPAGSTWLPKGHPAQGLLKMPGIASAIRLILENLKIPSREIFIHSLRGYKFAPVTEYRPTLQIEAHKTKEDIPEWLTAARQIRAVCKENGFRDVVVEISDYRARIARMTFPIHEEAPICKQWSLLRPQILQVLEGHNFRVLDVFRRGVRQNSSENPVTVFITIPLDDASDWTRIRDRIYEILSDAGLSDHAVEIRRASVCRFAGVRDTIMSPDDYAEKAQLGRSLGVQGDKERASTFGGFVELQSSDNGKWSKFGITCYHCVLPTDTSEASPEIRPYLEAWHKEGIKPGDSNAARLLVMTQPSLRDHKAMVDDLQKKITTGCNDPPYKQIKAWKDNGDFVQPSYTHMYQKLNAYLGSKIQQLEMAKKLFEEKKEHLGYVWAASGKRTTDDARSLDWALIKVDENRVSDNAITLVNPGLLTELGLPPPQWLWSDDQALQSLVGGETELLKVGKKSGFTSAIYNGLDSTHPLDQCWGNQSYTCKVLVGKAGCSDYGDSGGLIFDICGRVVGLLWGGNAAESITYFLRIDDLFADICRITGASAVRLPRPPPEAGLEGMMID